MPLLAGEIRPAMVEAVRRCRERLVTACLTNNWVSFDDSPRCPGRTGATTRSGSSTTSSSRSKVGVRKPDPRFYELACETAGVEPREVGVPRRPRRQPQAGRRPWA